MSAASAFHRQHLQKSVQLRVQGSHCKGALVDLLTGFICTQMRALLFVTVLTTGITGSMQKVERAVAAALDLEGAPATLLSD